MNTMKYLLWFLFVIQLFCVGLEGTLLYYNPDSYIIMICFVIAVCCATYSALQIKTLRERDAFISGDS